MAQTSRERKQAMYERRLAAGLCSQCGKTPPVAGGKTCGACRGAVAQRRAFLAPEQEASYAATRKQWEQANIERIAERDRRYRDKLRIETLTRYGGCCACCGLDTIEFLTLDHINGGGNIERRALFNGRNAAGNAYYRYLRTQGYPDGFQVLCWNCHMAKTHWGKCPHQLS